jgi:arsenate reductase
MDFSLVDVGKRPMAPAELNRFSQRLGAEALLDKSGKAYAKGGLGYLLMGEAEIVERLLADPALLRLPLVRRGQDVTVGVDEEHWRGWHQQS